MDKPVSAPLVILAIVAAAAYWLGVGTLVLGQVWAICVPGTAGCPTMLDMSIRAIGVAVAGLALFGVVVWLIRALHSSLTHAGPR